jgi:hypothetical protein
MAILKLMGQGLECRERSGTTDAIRDRGMLAYKWRMRNAYHPTETKQTSSRIHLLSVPFTKFFSCSLIWLRIATIIPIT